MLKLREKLRAIVSGSGHPAGVSLAVALGLTAGFASGVNLTFAVLVWLAVVLNVRTLWFCTTWIIGLTLALVLHSVCHGAGYALLDELRLGALIASMGERPIIALLDWDRYALVGGLAIGLVLAAPAARGAWMVADARWRANHEGQPTRGRLFRPYAWLHAPIAAVPLIFLPWVIVERQLADELLGESLVFANCRATAGRTQLCLWTGTWSAENVAIYSAEKPDVPSLRIGRIEANLKSSQLLRGWLHVDRLHVTGLERSSSTSPEKRDELRTIAEVSQDGAVPLHEYLGGWGQRRDSLQWAGDFVGLLDRLANSESHRRAGKDPLLGFLASTSDESRSRLGINQPRVVINSVIVDELAPTWQLGRKATIDLQHVSSNPRLSLYATQLLVRAPEWSAEVEVEFKLHETAQRHGLKVRATDIPVAELVDPIQTRSQLVIHRGLISITGEGWLDGQRVYLPVALDCQQLSAQLLGSARVAGISSESWNRGMRELGGLRAEALLNGRWNDVRLTMESRDVVNQLKHQLRSAGAHELLVLIDEELNGATPRLASNPVVPLPAVDTSETITTPATANLPVIEATKPNVVPMPNGSELPMPSLTPSLMPESNETPSASGEPSVDARLMSPLSAPSTVPENPPPVEPMISAAAYKIPMSVQPTQPIHATISQPIKGVGRVANPYLHDEIKNRPQAAAVSVGAPSSVIGSTRMPSGNATGNAGAHQASALISDQPIYTQHSAVTQTGATTVTSKAPPGPINLDVGPDLEGLTARPRGSNSTPHIVGSKPSATAPAESGLSKWSRDFSKRTSSMFSRTAKSQPSPTPDATARDMSYASDDSAASIPAEPKPAVRTAVRTQFDQIRR